MHGGPGSDNPERILYSGVPLTIILMRAFGVQAREISGPEWLETQKYDIEANIPPGTTPEQFQTMLQNLLKQRFGLVVHLETKYAADTAYDLALTKGGPKLKTTAEPIGPPKATQLREGSRMTVTFRRYSIAAFAKWLGMPLAKITPRNGYGQYSAARVLDDTGLLGEYDFTLEFSGAMGPGGALRAGSAADPGGAAPDDGGVDIFTALERQLGLKLEQKKVPLNILVVDHAEKVPTDN